MTNSILSRASMSLPRRLGPGRYPLLALAAVAGALALAACGDNAWREIVGPGDGGASGGAGRDSVAPGETRILLPLPGAVAAVGDSLRVRAAVRDESALAALTFEAFSLAGGRRAAVYEPVTVRWAAGDTVRTDTVAVTLPPRGTDAADTVYLVARSEDRAGNARSDTVRISLATIRGTRIALDNQVDRIVDMASDGRRLFLSNYSRNRVEVVEIAGEARSSFAVGSHPWGLALSPDSGTLYVANSGGTNISVVDLRAATPREDLARRIYTPDALLFQVPFSRDSAEVVDAAGRPAKVPVLVPSSVTEYDYSDRPQFIAQTRAGNLLYSTVPTSAAPDGTLRWRHTDGLVEIFLGYTRRDQPGNLVILNALAAGLLEGNPRNQLFVRDAEGRDHAGFVDVVERELLASGSKTRFEYFVNMDDIGLRDTTFVAVSGDHGSVAFGEGARNPGRIMYFRERAGNLMVQSGSTGDLVRNAAERVVGLTLDYDGTLGAARGANAYFFTPDLRLQGVGVTGQPAGGIRMHPAHRGYPDGALAEGPESVAFVTGRDDNGSPYVDVLDTFTFFRRRRVFLREAVTGPILAVRPPAGSSAALRLYGVTATGLLRLDLSAADLAR